MKASFEGLLGLIFGNLIFRELNFLGTYDLGEKREWQTEGGETDTYAAREKERMREKKNQK